MLIAFQNRANIYANPMNNYILNMVLYANSFDHVRYDFYLYTSETTC